VAVVTFPTGVVETLKFAVYAPAGIVTLEGTVAVDVFDDRLTTIPPVEVGPVKVTVPTAAVPPVTVVGTTETLARTGGTTVRFAVTELTPTEAVITAVTELETGDVETLNVVEVAPSGTETLVGTTAFPLLDDRPTTHPPVGAGPLRDTVPTERVPPVTDVGSKVKFVGTGG